MDDLGFEPQQDGRKTVRADGEGGPCLAIDHLLGEPPDHDLVASVVVPVRDEAEALPGLIDAFARQRTGDGRRLPRKRYEILLLFSRCVDGSAEVAAKAGAWRPDLRLHLAELPGRSGEVTVGMARRLLMDAAARRLEAVAPGRGVILTTDADTLVAPDWLVQTLMAIDGGADAVGGQVLMRPEDRAALPGPLRRRYLLDHAHQRLTARLEGLVDPDEDDPLPRHHQHAGASLAVTVDAYRRAGGMPPLATGEDEAFFRALKRSGARFRHSVAVRTFTSGRLKGRLDDGLAGTLRRWHQRAGDGRVPTPEALLERLELRARLRSLCRREDKGFCEVARLADAFGVEPARLAHWLGQPGPFFTVQEAVEQAAAPLPLMPLEPAVHGLRQLTLRYEGSRSRRSSRQVASRALPRWRKPGSLNATSWT